MNVALAIVQLIHIAGGAAWFGGSVFANLVLVPYVVRQPPERGRQLVRDLILKPERVMIAAALTAALSGLIRGAVFGRIDGLAALSTPYGLVWLASIGLAIVVFVVGGRLTSPAARALGDDAPADDDPGRRHAEHLSRLRTGFRIELAGITAILVLMAALPRL